MASYAFTPAPREHHALSLPPQSVLPPQGIQLPYASSDVVNDDHHQMYSPRSVRSHTMSTTSTSVKSTQDPFFTRLYYEEYPEVKRDIGFCRRAVYIRIHACI